MTTVMQAYESGVLVPEIHGRLVANLDQYAARANITAPMILTKMSAFGCTDSEINYAKTVRRRASVGTYGMVYEGREQTVSVLERMMAFAGACLRNFVDAKVTTLQELFSDIKEGSPPDATVLLIPNFFVARQEGGRIAEWHVSELLGLLYSRMSEGKQTIVYVSDFDALRKTYGDPIANHLANHFMSIEA